MTTVTENYVFSGAAEEHTVTLASGKVTTATIVLTAGGGAGGERADSGGGRGGHGAIVTLTDIPITDGDVIRVEVGEGGKASHSRFETGRLPDRGYGGEGGWPDGGDGGNCGYESHTAGGGGGSSRLYINNQLIAVAGAGGGSVSRKTAGDGGYPEGLEGEDVRNTFDGGGGGGTQTEGGDPVHGAGDNPNKKGGYLRGGDGWRDATWERFFPDQYSGGGGGGGYYGGGGGGGPGAREYASAGGGSSWVSAGYMGHASFSTSTNGGLGDAYPNAEDGGNGSIDVEYDDVGIGEDFELDMPFVGQAFIHTINLGSPGFTTLLNVELVGGGGGGGKAGSGPGRGGHGDSVTFSLDVEHGDVIVIEVGEGGYGHFVNSGGEGGAGGWPDGGAGGRPNSGTNSNHGLSGGGGSSRFYLNGTLMAVAGGGGGGAGFADGGDAAYPVGGSGEDGGPTGDATGPTGGTQSAGGTPSANGWTPDGSIGDYLYGGVGYRSGNSPSDRDWYTGGGGGGGYYGGGGGTHDSSSGGGSYPGGGAGSSYANTSVLDSITYTGTTNGAEGRTSFPANDGGDGSAWISYSLAANVLAEGEALSDIDITPPQARGSVDGALYYVYTGAAETIEITATSFVEALCVGGGGAGGIAGNGNPPTGRGGHSGVTYVEFIAETGQDLILYIGQGGRAAPDDTQGAPGGWPDGGPAGRGVVTDRTNGSGGGSTRIMLDSQLMAVAGAGGGAGSRGGDGGGDGGGLEGTDSRSSPQLGGTGGTQTEAGVSDARTSDTSAAGGQFQGGNGFREGITQDTADDFSGGGGGGGYYGGGGGVSGPLAAQFYLSGGGGSGYLHPTAAFTASYSQVGTEGGTDTANNNNTLPHGADGYILLKVTPFTGDVATVDFGDPVAVTAPEGSAGQPAEVEEDLPAPIAVTAPTADAEGFEQVGADITEMPEIEIVADIGGLGNISVNISTTVVDYSLVLTPPSASSSSGGAANDPDELPDFLAHWNIFAPQSIFAASIDAGGPPAVYLIAPAGTGELPNYFDVTGFGGDIEITGVIEGSAVSIAEYELTSPIEVDVIPMIGLAVKADGVEIVSMPTIGFVEPEATAFEEIRYEANPWADIDLIAPEAEGGNTIGVIVNESMMPVVQMAAPTVTAGGGYSLDVIEITTVTYPTPPEVIVQFSAAILVNFLPTIEIEWDGGFAQEEIDGEAAGTLDTIAISWTGAFTFQAGSNFATASPDNGLVVECGDPPNVSVEATHNAIAELPEIEVVDEIGGLGTVSAQILTPIVDYDITLVEPTGTGGGMAIAIGGVPSVVNMLAPMSSIAVSFSIDPFFDPIETTPPVAEGIQPSEGVGEAFDDVTLVAPDGYADVTADVDNPDIIAPVEISPPTGLFVMEAEVDIADLLVIDVTAPAVDASSGFTLDIDAMPEVSLETLDGSASGDGRFDARGQSEAADYHWRIRTFENVEQIAAAATGAVNVDADEMPDAITMQVPTAVLQFAASVFVNFLPKVTLYVPRAYTHEDVIDGMLPLPPVVVRAPDGYAEVDEIGFAPLRYLRSMTAGNEPSALEEREIAINEKDGVLFTNDGQGGIRKARLGDLAEFGLIPSGGQEGQVLRGDRTWGNVPAAYDKAARRRPDPFTTVTLSEGITGSGSATPQANTVYYRPFFVPKPITIIGLEVDVVSSAYSTAYLGIVSWSVSSDSPIATMAEGTTSMASTGVRSVSVNVTLEAGWYAAAFAVGGSNMPEINVSTGPKRVAGDFTECGDKTATLVGSLTPPPAPDGEDEEANAYLKATVL